MQYRHVPVLVREVVDYLGCSPGKTYVDGTLGGAGHAQAILRAIGPDGFLVGVDQDPDAVKWARESLRRVSSNVALFNDNFAQLPWILQAAGKARVHGIVLDLGVSRYQLEAGGRGFSFQRDEPLDMRMNPATTLTAEQIVNEFSEHDSA
ncbi:MAG: 16S rRNA (cytosine(1402)-N(4))-methyltransferase, partial [Deltaproteobacteria bacterium]|nr:16S rRNA (cytosine(1402)-N(4))-methyltransferase [Deltaproteobacteria bacterium]